MPNTADSTTLTPSPVFGEATAATTDNCSRTFDGQHEQATEDGAGNVDGAMLLRAISSAPDVMIRDDPSCNFGSSRNSEPEIKGATVNEDDDDVSV